MAAPKEDDLHALLDDALEGFDRDAASRGAHPQPPPPAAAAAAATEQAPAQQPAHVQGPSRRPGGLAFDPLARRNALRRDAAAAGGAPRAAPAAGGGRPQAAASDEPDAEELDVLSKGLSKLLAELAKAEEEGEDVIGEAAEVAAASGASQQPPAGQQQQQRQQREEQQREQLHATLQALSEQAPNFAAQGGSEADEMLRLLAEQLGALGDEGSANSSSGGGGGGAGGAGAAPGMASLVDTIMQQLLSKDVLYQPMKVSPPADWCAAA
ncbi:hypothetical protein COHA_010802 [Chlorella ohadii]|uniref:Peroxin-19 n=1 Tax=Chlorella ohadii TaxID=2649997 RepID=A0AAD5H0V5_9CHLO|nr:hypothetical protein COHA_010802 [Chlorella ohadii]